MTGTASATSESPPKYTSQKTLYDKESIASSVPDVPPPGSTFPATFAIGKRTTVSLIDIDYIKGHLALLHAFAELRKTVERTHNADMEPVMPKYYDGKWSWFVNLAVERFERWCFGLNSEKSGAFADNVPPLDVLMVWHAYLLNPSCYAEDTARIPALAGLARVTDDFISLLRNADAVARMVAEPSPETMKSWDAKTSIPFDPLKAGLVVKSRDLVCPMCGTTVSNVAYLNTYRSGYFHKDFQAWCPISTCNHKITREMLAIAKFAKDACREDGTDFSLFAGSLHTPTNPKDVLRARFVKDAILSFLRDPSLWPDRPSDNLERHILVTFSSRRAILKKVPEKGIKGVGTPLLEKILSAYNDDRIFSLDLAGAVIRQAVFVEMMHNIGWTVPSFYESAEDTIALQHAIARYHGFVDIIASLPTSLFVPTLDIDLVWHTHQLSARNYARDCGIFVGHFVDHSDKVEEDALSTAFDNTCRAWQDRFGIPYTHCGCPLPGNTVGQKLSRLVRQFHDRPYLELPQDAHKNAVLLDATHPSDHNAFYRAAEWAYTSDLNRLIRSNKKGRRRERDHELAKKGKSTLNAHQRERAIFHDRRAFMIPVPMFTSCDRVPNCLALPTPSPLPSVRAMAW